MIDEVSKLDERSLRIVALARSGVGGEKENARRILRQICEKKHLDFDQVLAGTNDEITERRLILGRLTKDEVSVIARVIMNFGMDKDHKTLNVLYYNNKPTGFAFECSKATFIETEHAANIYLLAFRKERRQILNSLSTAFVIKQQLHMPEFLREEMTASDDRELTKKEREKLERDHTRAVMMAAGMDGVQVRKALEANGR